MKKSWRCFVCQDVHLGFKAPEVCPTCGARKAYVEISTIEAMGLIQAFPREIDREAFLAAIEALAAFNEFQVNPDRDKVNLLLDGLMANEKNHGYKFCPCRLRTKDFLEDMKLICPCNFLIHETYRHRSDGECWCGLFQRRPG
jgi:ferredoxin-thioredoxin reductase catalytic subunit